MNKPNPFASLTGIPWKLLFAGLLAALLLPVTTAFAQLSPQDTTHASGWIVISVDDYQQLRARAYPAEREPDPPPLEATLTRVDYELRIAGDLATGRASLTVDVLKDGWVRVPVPSGLLVREARLDGKLVALVPGPAGKGSGQLSAMLAHAGRAVLLLDVALPISSAAGEESITLPSTSSGVTRAALSLPRQGVEVRLSGGLLTESSDIAGAPAVRNVNDSGKTETRWLGYGRGNEPLTFTWRRKIEDHHVTLPLRQRGSLTQLIGLGEDSTSVYAEVNLQVTQGAAREARIQLPEKVTINQVSGAMVADWEVKAGELVVTFLEPLEQSARFVITGETRTPRDGKIEVPLLRLLNVERDTGGVAVEVQGAGEIRDLKSQGLENADAADLGETIGGRQSPSLAAFRFRAGDVKAPRSLNVDVARYDQQAVLMANIEEARYHVLLSKEGKTLVQARYAVCNNQRNFLKVTLPAGAAIWSAALQGRPVRPGQASDGSVLLPLEKTRAGDEAPAFVLEFLYLVRDPKWPDKGRARLVLPALDLPVSRTGVVLFHPPMFRVTPEPGTFRSQAFEDPVAAALRPGGSGESSDDRDKKDFRTKQFDQACAGCGIGSGSGGGRGPDGTQSLVDSFNSKSPGGRGARVLPIRVSFPLFGPSMFLVSELTAENQAPAIELSYQQEKKEGGR